MKKIISLILSVTMLASAAQLYATADGVPTLQSETEQTATQSITQNHTESTQAVENGTDSENNVTETNNTSAENTNLSSENSDVEQGGNTTVANSPMLTSISGLTASTPSALFYSSISFTGSDGMVNLTIGDSPNGTPNVYVSRPTGETKQLWKFEKITTGDYIGAYKITNMYNGSGLVLDVAGSADEDGANVDVCTSDNSSAQCWYLYESNGSYMLSPACATDKILDFVTNSNNEQCKNVFLNTYSSSNPRLFNLDYSPAPENLGKEFYAYMTFEKNGQSANVGLGTNNTTSTLMLRTKNTSDLAQQWYFVKNDDDGSYKITNRHNNMALTVPVGSTGAGDSGLQVNDSTSITDNNQQRWFIYLQDNKYILRSKYNNYVALDIDGGNTTNGTRVHLYYYNGKVNQQFSIIKFTNEQDSNIKPVVNDSIKFTLFDYGDYINHINGVEGANNWRPVSDYFSFVYGTPESTDYYYAGFYSSAWNRNKGYYDADAFAPNHASVKPLLLNTYPVLNIETNAYGDKKGNGNDKGLSDEQLSLGYLFGAEQNNPSIKQYNPTNTILQEYDNNGVNHYYYSSTKQMLDNTALKDKANAVDYDYESNEFRIRNYAEADSGHSNHSGLFPFDNSIDTDNNPERDGNRQISFKDIDYWYGMRMDVDFIQSAGGKLTLNNSEKENMIFNFVGDDDIWVFIDDVLVLDLGGRHAAVKGSINFADGTITTAAKTANYNYSTTLKEQFGKANITPNGGWDGSTFADYTSHKLSLFYLERAEGMSTCCIDFNLPTPPENSLAVTKQVTDSNNKPIYGDNTEYSFQLCDKDGNLVTNELLLDYQKNGVIGTLTKGEFTLKGGETIYFTGLGESQYQIKEILSAEQKTYTTPTSTIEGFTGNDDSGGDTVMVTPAIDSTKTVKFTNTLKSLDVTLKYYGRETVNGKPADIKKEPTTYTKTYLASTMTEADFQKYFGTGTNYNIVQMITDTGVEFDSDEQQQDAKYKNVLDDYHLWTSQSAYTGANGISAFDNLHKKKSDGTYDKYTATEYHTNWYGYTQQLGDDGKWYWTDGENGTAKTEVADGQHEKWVTYYSYENGSKKEVGENGSNVTEVTIWLFNQPKQYTVQAFEANNFGELTNVDGKYVAQSVQPKSVSAYYNQRLGLEIDENAEYSQATNHLAGYGIDSYVGQKLDTAYSVKDSTGNTYKFAYWAFDPEGKKIASTDILYNYRIVTNTTLYAVYTSDGTVNNGKPGLTVSENERDIFFNSSGTSITRLNTEMNPYNCQNKDTNIKNVAIAYIIPSSTDAQFDLEAVKNAIKETLRYADETKDKDFYSITYSEQGIALEGIKKGNYFVFYVDGHNIPEDELTGVKDISLTNKNRIEFGSDFKTSALSGKRMYAFGAMYYTNEWIVSDNFIDYNFTTTSTTAG